MKTDRELLENIVRRVADIDEHMEKAKTINRKLVQSKLGTIYADVWTLLQPELDSQRNLRVKVAELKRS